MAEKQTEGTYYKGNNTKVIEEEREELKRLQKKMRQNDLDRNFAYQKQIRQIEGQGEFWQGKDLKLTRLIQESLGNLKRVEKSREEIMEEVDEKLKGKENDEH